MKPMKADEPITSEAAEKRKLDTVQNGLTAESFWSLARYQGRRYGVLIALCMLFIIFSLMEPRFYGLKNILTIIRQAAILGILSLGLTVVVISGEFDISFAASATFAGVLSVVLLKNGVDVYTSSLIGWASSVAVSLFNAITILYIGIPSFIATLGMMAALTGISRCLTGGATCYSAYFPASFAVLGRAFAFKIVPIPVITFVLVSAIALTLLENTRRGRYLYVTGANPSAASRAGINVRRMKLTALVICGLCSGLAGLTTVSMLGSANPVICDGYLMPAIIGCFLGAVFLRVGIPNVTGTVVSCLLLAVLTNGFVMIGLPFYMKEIIQGIVLLVSVGTVALLKKGRVASIEFGY